MTTEPQGNTNGDATDTPTTTDAPATTTVLTDETQAAEGAETTVLTDDKSDGEGEKPVVPETYEEFKLPEGMKLDEQLSGKFSELAKGLNLTQESAQKVIDLAGEHALQLANKQAQDWASTRKTWVEDIKKDSDFGGNNFTETVGRAQRVLRQYGSPELKSFLNLGYGDNPEVIKLLARVDKALGEDKSEGGEPPKEKTLQRHELYYGSDNK